MFRTVPLSIIRSFSLYTQQWYMSYRFADRSKLSLNLYDIYHCCVYNEKLLMVHRGTVRNMQSFTPKINLRNQCILLVRIEINSLGNVCCLLQASVNVFKFSLHYEYFPIILTTLQLCIGHVAQNPIPVVDVRVITSRNPAQFLQASHVIFFGV